MSDPQNTPALSLGAVVQLVLAANKVGWEQGTAYAQALAEPTLATEPVPAPANDPDPLAVVTILYWSPAGNGLMAFGPDATPFDQMSIPIALVRRSGRVDWQPAAIHMRYDPPAWLGGDPVIPAGDDE